MNKNFLYLATSWRVALCMTIPGFLSFTPTVPAQAQDTPAPMVAADAVQEAFVRVAERIKPSVVNIYAERRSAPSTDEAAPKATPDDKPGKPGEKPAPSKPNPKRTPRPNEEEEEPLSPFSFGPRDPRERQTSLGTGMVVRSDGYILTNYHTVKEAEFIRVIFDADSEQPDRPAATIVASDEDSDLAVLKVDRQGLRPIEFADSDTVRIGEWAVAIGAPFEQAQSVTVGIVSAKGRHLPTEGRSSLQDYIQTDASINPGNSGGPLLNLEGKVIGINTAILSPSRYNVGIGFAVPSNTVRLHLPILLSGKNIARGFLGINYVRIDKEVAREFGVADGVQIGALARDEETGKPIGPAGTAGLRDGDIITAIDGQQIASSEEFRRKVSSTAPGRQIMLAVVRPIGDRTEKLDVPVTLGDWAAQNPKKPTTSQPSRSAAAASRLGLELKNATDLNSLDRQRFDLEEKIRGVVIYDVEPGSPADDAEINRGLIIVRVRPSGGAWQSISSKAAFESFERSLQAGTRLLMQLRSGNGVSLYKVLIVPPAQPARPAPPAGSVG